VPRSSHFSKGDAVKIFKNLVLAAALAVACDAAAVAGEWPARAVEFVVPANPGGDSDINCRIFLKYMEKELGQSMITVNMAGAGGAVGMNNVAQARPDGYRALFYHAGALIGKIMDIVPYSVTGDYEVAAMPVIDKSNCFAANVKAPYSNPKELVEYAKAHPEEISFATEVGSFTHLHVLALEEAAGIKFNIADAGTASEKITALLGGRIDIIGTQYGLIKDYMKNGEFKCVGILSDQKLTGAEDAPIFKDAGYDLVFDKFFYVAFPKGTDRAIIEKFNAAAGRVAQNPDYIKECQNNFVNAAHMTPDAAVKYIDGEMANYMKYEASLLGGE
jgi:tripartite-type tricarboxylate transporter receptor subunit TctC